MAVPYFIYVYVYTHYIETERYIDILCMYVHMHCFTCLQNKRVSSSLVLK